MYIMCAFVNAARCCGSLLHHDCSGISELRLSRRGRAFPRTCPLPGGTVALAQSLGIDPVPDRGRFVYELTRLLYNTPEGRKPAADAYLNAAAPGAARGADVRVSTRGRARSCRCR